MVRAAVSSWVTRLVKVSSCSSRGGDVDGDAGGFHFGEDSGEGEFEVEVEFEFVDGGEFGGEGGCEF